MREQVADLMDQLLSRSYEVSYAETNNRLGQVGAVASSPSNAVQTMTQPA